jgi:hypothetical protein
MRQWRGSKGRAKATSPPSAKKPAPAISAIDDNNLTEAEIIERAKHGDDAMFE